MSNDIVPASTSMIHLDGTTLEGGGQLLRLSLSLSSLTRIPIHITDIRGKRGPKSNPGGKHGGMKPAHLAGAEWLAKVTRATTTGMIVRSKELVFQPARVNSETTTDPEINLEKEAEISKRIPEWWEIPSSEGVWDNIYEDGRLVRQESHISMSTPGSVFLVLQAILPYILFSAPSLSMAAPPRSDHEVESVPVKITIEGGSNAFHSLSYEYASQVLFPMLHEKVGIPPITMTLNRRGWSMGRADVGSVTFDIRPLAPDSVLPALRMTNRGQVTKVHVSLLAPTTAARMRIRENVVEQLLRRHPGIEILFAVDEDSKDLKRLYLLLVAETSNGYRLGRDWLFDQKLKPDTLDKSVDTLVAQVVRDLNQELAHGGCVDEYMQDQLVVFQALARGSSIVDAGQDKLASLHTRTAQWVVEKILGLKHNEENCHGIGFKAGQQSWSFPNMPNQDSVTARMEQLKI